MSSDDPFSHDLFNNTGFCSGLGASGNERPPVGAVMSIDPAKMRSSSIWRRTPRCR